jgi:hypothetical protein
MFDFLIKSISIKKADYEDMIHAIGGSSELRRSVDETRFAGGLRPHANKNPEYIIINTLPIGEQSVLIKGTLPYTEEETTINKIIESYTMDTTIIIVYGKNANDESAEKKCRQIKQLGFRNIFLYGGGLFEWLLLQDIFGDINFPTIGKTDNFLKYKPPSNISRVVYRSIKYG